MKIKQHKDALILQNLYDYLQSLKESSTKEYNNYEIIEEVPEIFNILGWSDIGL